MISAQDEIRKVLYDDGLPSAHTSRANFALKKDESGVQKIHRFEGVKHIVTCDLCEFMRPCRSANEAEVIRVAHLGSAHHDQILAGGATYHLTMVMP